MPEPKRTEKEIAAKTVASYGKAEVQSIHLRDLLLYALQQSERGLFWEAGARVEEGGSIHEDSVPGANFLYRAMSTREYYHLRRDGLMPQSSTHHGLAPNRSYSRQYLRPSYGATHLVEFRFPTSFRETLYTQGWKDGSLEKGCIAWGIGKKQKNSWKRDASRGVQTIPKSKSTARHPYDIYKDFVAKGWVSWKLVNVKYHDKGWVGAILASIK